ncbi:hypothetical protein [Ensifer sp. LC163]|uniref:hypothetical protein n=1 Tax=Ensifer sp. LC163 TaxID=1120652 RepID=UPI0008136286|nr:hypothetical protein [Ensifer sp. LC163]OCP37861.1 hypothetical protein BC360_21185 [Ensifer sp. LC163]
MSDILAAMLKTAIIWLFGGTAGAFLALMGMDILDAFNIIGGCQGLGCLHPTYTVIMPLGAILGIVLGTVLVARFERG